MRLNHWLLSWGVVAALAGWGCGDGAGGSVAGTVADTTSPLLQLLPPEQTGVKFANNLNETDTLNYFHYEYFYNGAGVSAGDLDNDGLPDLVFTGNQVPNRAYRNLGDLKFEDVSAKVFGTDPGGWNTGVNMVDLNADGLLDLYICRSGPRKSPSQRRNLLYMNQGDWKFTEQAEQYGIADTGQSMQAIFMDIDADQDLDLYVMNHPPFGKKVNNLEVAAMIAAQQGPTHRLYRNDGERFTDITDAARARTYAFGLGICAGDLRGDGTQYLYVANDFEEPDRLFHVNKGPDFSDEIRIRTQHISYFGMGIDIADMNNDGHLDILELDMAFPQHTRSKRLMASMSPQKFWAMVAAGFHRQYMQNTLHMNTGQGDFVDVAQAMGVAKTDWSWTPLFADLDLDGYKDLMVTNGFRRDTKDNDVPQKLREKSAGKPGLTFQEAVSVIPTSKVRNFLFQNRGGVRFEDKSEAWGFVRPFNSNGATYADLDRDGDLELILNNLDEPAGIYENHARQQNRGNYLAISLKSKGSPSPAYGKRVILRSKGQQQVLELMPTRGYLGSVDPVLHFGVGDADKIDTLEIWIQGPKRIIRRLNVPVNQLLEIDLDKETIIDSRVSLPVTLMEMPGGKETVATFRHQERPYDDFAREILLPHRQSQLGPFISTGDVNGDGTVDYYIGGAAGQPGGLFLQRPESGFQRTSDATWQADQAYEDLGSTLFDADGDGDLDLYVVSGSNENSDPSLLIDRLYRNDGKGNFTRDKDAIPAFAASGSMVISGDIDGDKDLDLFVGGRGQAGKYPSADRSFLLLNEGGRFRDVTAENAPGLQTPGMVTAAVFWDYDQDKDLDLLLAGEWMPVQLFSNQGGKFSAAAGISGFAHSAGWWSSLAIADLNGDGRADIIGGNLGLNSKFQASEKKPVHIYYDDFDGNGSGDIVLAKLEGSTCYPVRGRECSSQQMPFILDKFPTYQQFAEASIEQIYGPDKLAASLHLQAEEMRSGVFWNEGASKFRFEPLPFMAQLAPVNGILVRDVNLDGHADLLLAGGNHDTEVETVAYDAGIGTVLLGEGKGGFRHLPNLQSGFWAEGNVKHLAILPRIRGGDYVLVARNDATLTYIHLPGAPAQ